MFDTRKTFIDGRIPPNGGASAPTFPCSLLCLCVIASRRRTTTSIQPAPFLDSPEHKNIKSTSFVAGHQLPSRQPHSSSSATAPALQFFPRKQQTARTHRALHRSRRNPHNQAPSKSKHSALSGSRAFECQHVPSHCSEHPKTKLIPLPLAQPPSSTNPLLTTSTSSFPNAPLSVQSVLVKTSQVGRWGYRASAAAERI